ncbi:hypothetical protein [Microbacterium sp. Clip185]|uniref:hypothetical protein n=1 Tax=Microbacterium sp. Clip185 TaxID=3025663 RepID=UPI002365BF8F|nr:hypothetical protein [Microbacterium sp. Clip185]WDG16863.1 hypothetical protein PQV94_09410 [Microbacterium sp. Clip185]
MATKTTSTKTPKPVETVEAAAFDEALPAIEAAIQQVVDTFGVTVQRARLKGIRALAYQALVESIEAGDLEALTQRAITNAGSLPNGWTVTPPRRAPKADAATAAKEPAARKPRVTKGSTVATEEGVVIAEQRHSELS